MSRDEKLYSAHIVFLLHYINIKIKMTDPAEIFRTQILRQLNNENEDDEDNPQLAPDDDDLENEPVDDQILPNESEDDEIETDLVDSDVTNRKKFYGRDGTVWSSTVPTEHPSSFRIVMSGRRGPSLAIENETPENFFRLFMSTRMINLIVHHTNSKIEVVRQRYTEQRFVDKTSNEEIAALIGILLYAGVTRNCLLPIEDVFNQLHGQPLFRCTMTEMRFKFLINCIRFDDWKLRLPGQPRSPDKFTPIREIWELFLEGCRENYLPSNEITIDETMLRFFGRCSFRMYLPAKPDRYGLKIITAADAKTFYFLNGQPYLGRAANETEMEESRKMIKGRRISAQASETPASTSTATTPVVLLKATKVVQELIEPFKNQHRNLTCDNWFTSMQLADHLSEIGWTIVGTMRKSRKEIPLELLQARKSDVGSARHVFRGEKTLCSFVPKLRKTVVLLSTKHHSNRMSIMSQKPEIIEDYNAFKGGVDTFNQMIKSRTVRRKTRRWPLRVFYFIIDAAAYNSYVLFREKNDISRIEYMKRLSLDMVEKFTKRRLEIRNLNLELRTSIQTFRKSAYSDVAVALAQADAGIKPTSRCHICMMENRGERAKKATNYCSVCKWAVCGEHNKKIIVCRHCAD